MADLVAVVGPTAIGKSKLALKICELFSGELVSVDSMQIYRHMNIGTAKPSPEEQARVPHHLIDICEPTESFSAADFSVLAHKEIAGIRSAGHLPVLCGGTGLYMDTILAGLPFGEAKSDEALRAKLLEVAEKEGVDALHRILEEKDPVAAASIHKNNVKRVIRAIEICQNSGLTKTEWDKTALSAAKPYNALRIGLSVRSRDFLYEKINRRVDKMMQDGLLEETKGLWQAGIFETNATAAAAIGYKELLPFLRGEASLDACVEALKAATRQYAKRQLTWFSRNGAPTHWFYLEDYSSWDDLEVAVVETVQKE